MTWTVNLSGSGHVEATGDGEERAKNGEQQERAIIARLNQALYGLSKAGIRLVGSFSGTHVQTATLTPDQGSTTEPGTRGDDKPRGEGTMTGAEAGLVEPVGVRGRGGGGSTARKDAASEPSSPTSASGASSETNSEEDA